MTTIEETATAPKADSDTDPLWKTSLCSYFRSTNGSNRKRRGGATCSHGDACRYAHSEEELRPRPDSSWDPTSERAKKMQKLNGPDKDSDAVEDEEVDVNALDKCIIGVPMRWVTDDLKKFLDAEGIQYKEAKKKKGMQVAFVVFENAEQVKNSIEVMKEKTIAGKEIKVRDAARRNYPPKKTSIVTESNQNGEVDNNDDVGEDNTAIEGLGTKTRSARDAVTPLAHMSYSDQLEHKKTSLSQMLKRLTRNARKACPEAVPLPDWIQNSRQIGGLPCKFEGILESPLVDGYRNKCEFSVGQSVDGKRSVGFMLGNFREGVTAVEGPANCPNISNIACNYALIFEDFLQSSEFPIWNRVDNTGFWRQLTVREGRKPIQTDIAKNVTIAEVMLIVQVCSVNIDEELMKNEFKRMTMAFAEGAASSIPPLPLSKLVVQDHKGISNAAPADCPLLTLPLHNAGDYTAKESIMEEARIHDYISNLRFSISPTAFFQVNTLAAERLYSLAGDWAELNSDTLLFDVCCGTGTIGLTLAHRVGMVVGIEMNASAVSDANRNAEINGIKNCKFVCGKAEDVMGSLLKEYLGIPQKYNAASVSTAASTICNGEGASNLETEGVSLDLPTNISSLEMLTGKESSEQNLDVEPLVDCEKENGNKDSLGSENSHPKEAECSMTPLKNEECKEVKPDVDFGEREEDKKTEDATPVLQFKNVVAIVDPPRVGLHPIVIKALRTHPRIRRLVYISCNPESLVANAIELCTPTSEKAEKGQGHRGWRKMSSAGLARQRTKNMPNSEPFSPVKAMAVDLFPHTPHCEMVMLLER